MRKPIITDETHAEYISYDKAKQLGIKDVGGFVGGVIRGGRRLINSISARYLITLDIDEADADFPETIQMLYGYEMLITSTHKHGPGMPRFRVIMPMTREVLSDEYEAIARKIAGNIDIELFDPTTFQPERLMFWPSTSKDVQYVYVHQAGDWIDPDAVLAEYADWKDSSQWPISKKAADRIKKSLDKQEDPTTKPGMIGVFCRRYGIKEAIEKFIPDVYLPTAHDDRYTYALGSTAAGMIVYDDQFMYSHHSTDPTMGRLCNAFDMIRIHLYHDLDDGVLETVPNNKRPSFVKVQELISNDPEVKRMGLTEQLRRVKGDFEMPIEANLDWTEKLETDKKGNVLGTIANVVMILNNDFYLNKVLAWDDFEKNPVALRDLPWRQIDRVNRTDKALRDTDDAGFRNYFEQVYKISSASKIKDGMDIVMMQNQFHPVRDYLTRISTGWDGKPRVEKLLVDALGVEDSVYVREITRKTLVAAVARVFEPGCKFDYVLTLIGSQGLGKSRLIAQLGGSWYSDTFGRLDNNQAMENIHGVWIMEIGEMAGFKRQEVETIKLFIAKREDRFRVAYGKRVMPFPRQCIFIASTNDKTPLHDQTGGRRFWTAECTSKFKGLTQKEVDQIWAEACHFYAQGEDLYLTDEVEEMARKEQKERTEQDERLGMIQNYLDMPVPEDWYMQSTYNRRAIIQGNEELTNKNTFVRDRICTAEIWTELIGGKEADMSPFNTKFIRQAMNNMGGWKSKLVKIRGWGDQRGWVRVNEFEDITV